MDVAAYRAQLQALLPPGAAWPRHPGAVLTRVLTSFGGGLARMEARAADLFDEADPRTAVQLLPEWERLAGLPDGCAGAATGVEARRRRVIQVLTMRGGQSRAWFVALAEALGYPGCSVSEFRPFACDAACDEAVRAPGWRYVWRLNIPDGGGIDRMSCRSGCDEPLRSWGDGTLECVIRRAAPAHTTVLFGYGYGRAVSEENGTVLVEESGMVWLEEGAL